MLFFSCHYLCSLFFFSSRRRHTRCREVSWARRCVQETGIRDQQISKAAARRSLDDLLSYFLGQRQRIFQHLIGSEDLVHDLRVGVEQAQVFAQGRLQKVLWVVGKDDLQASGSHIRRNALHFAGKHYPYSLDETPRLQRNDLHYAGTILHWDIPLVFALHSWQITLLGISFH
eukprot:TRINITY_DN25303_c0_g1_i1.p1 TRINITY_DN25303_c0_g1~~TRINITY_DN25303_c0_g1_i1.p1  ORF type:complete len:173 (-),score=31.35 TRINITY_DN25303_c0_g1_i1:41-559(-)